MHGNHSDAKWPLPPKWIFCRKISSHLFGYNQPRLSIVSYIYMFHAPMSIMKRGLLSFEEFNWLRPIFMGKIQVQKTDQTTSHIICHLYVFPITHRHTMMIDWYIYISFNSFKIYIISITLTFLLTECLVILFMIHPLHCTDNRVLFIFRSTSDKYIGLVEKNKACLSKTYFCE